MPNVSVDIVSPAKIIVVEVIPPPQVIHVETVSRVGPPGEDGADGIQGPPGPVHPGGTTGQVLTKLSDADGDVGWADPTGGLPPTEETVTIETTAGNDAGLDSPGADYATAISGSGASVRPGGVGYNGQTFGAGTYICYETFLRFDTRAIPAGATITSVTLQTAHEDNASVTDYIIEARGYPFSVINAGVWRNAAQLAALPLWATYATSDLPPSTRTLFDWVSETAFKDGIVKGGYTSMVIVSEHETTGTAPSGQEYVGLAMQELGIFEDLPLPGQLGLYTPRLVITYTV